MPIEEALETLLRLRAICKACYDRITGLFPDVELQLSKKHEMACFWWEEAAFGCSIALTGRCSWH